MAGRDNGYYSVGVGHNARSSSFHGWNVACGYNAGMNNQGNFAIAVGAFSGQTNQEQPALAVGLYSGYSDQGVSSVSCGSYCGASIIPVFDSDNQNCTYVGSHAGQNNAGVNNVFIGNSAGMKAGVHTVNDNTVAIGHNCAANTVLPQNAVAFGCDCLVPSGARLALGSHMEELATTAVLGSNGDVPAQVAGYIRIEYNGKLCKIPIFNN